MRESANTWKCNDVHIYKHELWCESEYEQMRYYVLKTNVSSESVVLLHQSVMPLLSFLCTLEHFELSLFHSLLLTLCYECDKRI